MAALYPPGPGPGMNNMQESPPQHGVPRPRNYTPYIFQPNFLKQQMRRRDGMPGQMGGITTGANSIPVNDAGRMGGGGPGMSQGTGDIGMTGMSIEDMQRKKSGRRVIDWTSSCLLYLESRKFRRDCIDTPQLMPDPAFTMEMQTAAAYWENPVTSITSKFVRSATNKMKCPIYKVVWTPDGRRLVTGSASGEFTLWNGTAFNFETILQAHDCPVRAMAWSKYDSWLITGDNQGYIKYWQLNMNNVKMYQAHKDQACRSVSFGPTDHKFATASDDGTVRIWDFLRCHEERIMRGHGADVKQVDWHPHKGIVISASKDLHTPIKVWDPKTGQSLTTIHAHKGTVMDIKWNQNGNWFLSASRDHLVKLYDIRNLKQEMQVFRGHKKEAFSVAWHPIHEDLFATGGSEGTIMFWQVGEEKESGTLDGAHDGLIWSLAWHPLGHVLVSGSNDHSTKFWARNRPGDSMRDRYNLCLLPPQHEEPTPSNIGASSSLTDNEELRKEVSVIPGMGDTDVVAAEVAKRDEEEQKTGIPGLDWSYEEKNEFERKLSAQHDRRKIPYARPVPRAFVAAWEANKEGAPPDRRRSPFYRDRRPPFDGGPRDFRRRDEGPFRRGRRPPRPEKRKSVDEEDDDRIFVDGVEVGPDYKPPDMINEEEREKEKDIPRPRSPRGPDLGPPRRLSRGSIGDNHTGGPPERGRDPMLDRREPGRLPLPGREPLDVGPGGPPGPRDFPDRLPRDGPPDFGPDGPWLGDGPPDPNFRNDPKGRPPFNDIDKNNLPFPEDMDDLALQRSIMEDERFLRENGFPIEDLQMLAEQADMRDEPPPPDLGPMRMRGGPDIRGPGRGRGFRGRRGFSPKRDKRGRGGRGRKSPPPRMRRGGGPPR